MWLRAPCTFRVQEMKLIWGKEDLVQRIGMHLGFLSSTVANTVGSKYTVHTDGVIHTFRVFDIKQQEHDVIHTFRIFDRK